MGIYEILIIEKPSQIQYLQGLLLILRYFVKMPVAGLEPDTKNPQSLDFTHFLKIRVHFHVHYYSIKKRG